jgi:precorrin-3B synthase
VSKPDAPGRTRPDACPGALQVHEAADGPLARVRLPGGLIRADQLRVLADCAATLGNGVIELTSRGNVQVRGLSGTVPGGGSAAEAFAARIAAAGLLPSATHERVRNIVASPFGEADLVDALDRELCARPGLARLPGRFLFSIGDLGLDADVTYAAGRLLLAGRDAGLAVPPERAVPTMLDAAEAFLRLRTTEWRIAELADGPARIAAALGGTAGEVRQAPPQPREPGVVAQPSGGLAVQALVPLGRLTPEQAHAIAGLAAEVRFTPWRTVVVRDVADPGAVRHGLAAAGLVTDPRSPWVGVTACTGLPGCARALADVRADAAAWVRARTAPAEVPVHWSGCERRCGLPRGRVRQMVATATGYREEGP